MTLDSLLDLGAAGDADFTEPRHVPESEAKPLGSLRGRSFVAIGDAEYELGGEVRPAEKFNRPRAGEVWIDRVQRHRDPVFGAQRGPVTDVTTFRAWPVPAGSFAALQAKHEQAAQAKAAKAEQRSRIMPVDRLGLLPAARAIPATVIPIARESDLNMAGLEAFVPSVAAKPMAITTKGRAAAHDLDGVLRLLADSGIAVQVVGGKLLVATKAGALSTAMLILIATMKELIIGRLRGEPLVCAMKHKGTPPPAVTLGAIDVPLCAAHRDGDA